MTVSSSRWYSVLILLQWLFFVAPPAGAQDPANSKQGYDAAFNSSGGVVASQSYIDASQFVSTTTNPDFCNVVYQALNGAFTPANPVIDARSLPSTTASMTCAANTTPWLNTGGTYLNKPSTILLPSGTITIPITWILPHDTKLAGIEPSTVTSVKANTASGTVILAGSNFPSSSAIPMIQFGDSHCPSGGCRGIAIEGVVLDGNGLNVIGIQNSNAQDFSYVDHVAIYKVLGTGLMISGNAQHSGPYSNITFDSGTSAPTACAQILNVTAGGTHGIHGLTCISGALAGTAVLLDSSSNSLEDIRVIGFENGVLVGSQGVAKSNVLLNIIGDTNGTASTPIYVIQISAATSVTDLAIVGVANTVTSPTDVYTLLDNSQSPVTQTTSPIGLYALGEGSSGGFSRFTTSPTAATWATGNSSPGGSCSIGSLFTIPGTLTTAAHFYVCAVGTTGNWQPVF